MTDIPLFLSSAEASHTDLSQSRATFQLETPIVFPKGSAVKLACQKVEYTNFFYNVSAAIGNNTMYYTDTLATPQKYNITIPDGDYNVEELSDKIALGLVANGHDADLWKFQADNSTGRVFVYIHDIGWQVNFAANSPYALLGFTSGQKVPSAALTVASLADTTAADYNELGASQATLNSVSTVYLHTSLTNQSTYCNKSSNIVMTASPNADTGALCTVADYNLTWVPTTLEGSSVSSITIFLTDQNDKTIALTDNFSCSLILRQGS